MHKFTGKASLMVFFCCLIFFDVAFSLIIVLKCFISFIAASKSGFNILNLNNIKLSHDIPLLYALVYFVIFVTNEIRENETLLLFGAALNILLFINITIY